MKGSSITWARLAPKPISTKALTRWTWRCSSAARQLPPKASVAEFVQPGGRTYCDILKRSVVPAELSPRAIRWPAGPAAGPDPQAGDQHLRHPHRPHHPAVSGIYAEGRGDGYRAERGIRLHGRDADPYQVANAAAARSRAG